MTSHDEKREELEYEVDIARWRLGLAELALLNHDRWMPLPPQLPPLPPFIRRLLTPIRIPLLPTVPQLPPLTLR